jgi:hypothetical protein
MKGFRRANDRQDWPSHFGKVMEEYPEAEGTHRSKYPSVFYDYYVYLTI